MRFRISILVIALAALSACGNAEPEATSSTSLEPPVQSTESDSRTAPNTPLPVAVEVPTEILEAILTDASERSKTPPADLFVARAESVEWSDGSLGCSEPGQMYTQAIVPGYWVEVEAGDRTLDYRSDDQGNFRLCDRLDGTTPSTIDR